MKTIVISTNRKITRAQVVFITDGVSVTKHLQKLGNVWYDKFGACIGSQSLGI